jgi:hypothetical protein
VRGKQRAADRFLIYLLFAAVAVLPGAAPAADGDDGSLTLHIQNIGINSGYLVFDLLLEGAFTKGQEQTLLEGFPTHMTYTVELWRERGMWFDKLELSRTLTIRVTYDLWAQRFVVQFRKDNLDKFDTIEDVEEATCSLPGLKLVPVEELDPSKSYYIAARAHLRPLTIEELGELEDWLSGELRPGDSKGGGVLSVPKYLVRMLLGSAGVTDRSTLTKSETFSPKVSGVQNEGRG